jgi:hypothetical protein
LPNEFTKRLKKERNSKRTIATETLILDHRNR